MSVEGSHGPRGSSQYRSGLRFLVEGIEGLAVLVATFGTWPLSKRWLRNWGSSPAEREHSWPGDRYVAVDHQTYTRAIDIAAPGDAVWPWIVQFGLGRAGFYSYELLERLAGIPVTNLESIEPSMQSLSVGDAIRLHPKAPGIPVAELMPGRYVCFGVEAPAVSAADQEPARSWLIYLEPQAANSCRLILRGCVERPRGPSWSKRAAFAIAEPVDFVMEQRMLRTIKRLAERTPRNQPAQATG